MSLLFLPFSFLSYFLFFSFFFQSSLNFSAPSLHSSSLSFFPLILSSFWEIFWAPTRCQLLYRIWTYIPFWRRERYWLQRPEGEKEHTFTSYGRHRETLFRFPSWVYCPTIITLLVEGLQLLALVRSVSDFDPRSCFSWCDPYPVSKQSCDTRVWPFACNLGTLGTMEALQCWPRLFTSV